MPLVNLMALDRSIAGGLARRVREIRERSIHHGDFDVLDRLADAIELDVPGARRIGGADQKPEPDEVPPRPRLEDLRSA